MCTHDIRQKESAECGTFGRSCLAGYPNGWLKGAAGIAFYFIKPKSSWKNFLFLSFFFAHITADDEDDDNVRHSITYIYKCIYNMIFDNVLYMYMMRLVMKMQSQNARQLT